VLALLLLLALLAMAPHKVASAAPPKLVAVGAAEIVYNRSADGCPGLNWAGHPGDECDSMPTAWHDPLSNTTRLLSAVNWGMYATKGPSLDELVPHHDCARAVFSSGKDPRPEAYNNHQWLQAPRVFANGTGFAMVHNEFHGEQPPHNASYCSFQSKTSTGQCIEWSTDLATTANGGASWELTYAPLFTLPRKYIKDAPIAGYGELGTVQRNTHDGFYYGLVSRKYRNGTGAGPPGTAAEGTCVFRSAAPLDPASYRGWNGSEWSTTWVDPYTTAVPTESLWRHTCANIDVGGVGKGDAGSTHWNPKRLVSTPTGDDSTAWPSHVMTGLPWQGGARGARVSYTFLGAEGAADGPAPFTAWAEPQYLEVGDWLDPHLFGGKLMYPALIDHSSPFALSAGSDDPGVRSDGLSYALIGGHGHGSSLYLYFVVDRGYIARLPLAFVDASAPTPRGGFPPLPPILPSCTAVNVTGAGLEGVDGVYVKDTAGGGGATAAATWTKDATHQLYCSSKHPTKQPCRWTLAHKGAHAPVSYEASDKVHTAQPPPEGWITSVDTGLVGVPPLPTITCARSS